MNSPKVLEFLEFAEANEGKEIADHCRKKLAESDADDFAPLEVLNSVLCEVADEQFKEARVADEKPFDSD